MGHICGAERSRCGEPGEVALKMRPETGCGGVTAHCTRNEERMRKRSEEEGEERRLLDDDGDDDDMVMVLIAICMSRLLADRAVGRRILLVKDGATTFLLLSLSLPPALSLSLLRSVRPETESGRLPEGAPNVSKN